MYTGPAQIHSGRPQGKHSNNALTTKDYDFGRPNPVPKTQLHGFKVALLGGALLLSMLVQSFWSDRTSSPVFNAGLGFRALAVLSMSAVVEKVIR